MPVQLGFSFYTTGGNLYNMNKKKILIILQGLRGGGAEKVLIDIIKNFDYNSYSVTLLLVGQDGVYNDQIAPEVEVKYLFIPREQWLLGYLQKMKFWTIVDAYYKYKLNSCLGKSSYDTIISFMEGVSTRCHSFILNRAKKHVTWVHIDMLLNNWCLNSFRSFDEQATIYTKMDEIICVSDGAKDSFMKLFPGTKPKVVYNLIDKPQIFHKASALEIKNKSFTVCNVGRLANQKRQDRIVEVAALCKKAGLDIQFNILGQGPLLESLNEKIAKLGVENYVHLLGFQPNPYPYISASDIFFMTSDSEGYPLVVCESLCLGKPVVSTDVTGPHELLSDGTGILCSKDPQDLFEAIKLLYSDKALMEDYIKRSLAKSSIFDVEKQMKDIYAIIN